MSKGARGQKNTCIGREINLLTEIATTGSRNAGDR